MLLVFRQQVNSRLHPRSTIYHHINYSGTKHKWSWKVSLVRSLFTCNYEGKFLKLWSKRGGLSPIKSMTYHHHTHQVNDLSSFHPPSQQLITVSPTKSTAYHCLTHQVNSLSLSHLPSQWHIISPTNSSSPSHPPSQQLITVSPTKPITCHRLTHQVSSFKSLWQTKWSRSHLADREAQATWHCSTGSTDHRNTLYTRWHSAAPQQSCTCQGDRTVAWQFPPGSRTLADRCRHPDPEKGWSCWNPGCSNTLRCISLWAGQGQSGRSIHHQGRAHSLTGTFGGSSCCTFLE